jgi:hypothetical protein
MSVLAKSSPAKSRLSPATDALAYARQSPKFNAAACRRRPNFRNARTAAFHSCSPHEIVDLFRGCHPAPARVYQARFHERRRSDADVVGLEDLVHEGQVTRLGKENRDEDRRIERHTPPSP